MQGGLAGLGALAALWAWGSGRGWLWLLGALFLGSVIPFTLRVIMPTNNRLKDPTLDVASAEASDLLARWASLHAVRSITGVISFLIFVVALLRS